MNETLTLTEKYKPRAVQDLILPPNHGLALSLEFLTNPYPSAFLLYGKSGLGKTSLAELMAKAAAGNPHNVMRYVGPDLNSDVIRQLTNMFSTPSLYGGLYAVVVNEADAIPKIAQVRLLDLLDRLREHHLVLILTSNDELPDFDSRFLSRTKPQLFTAQGLAPRAQDWLLRIASAEGLLLSRPEAARIVKLAKNNLRACLQSLELLAAKRRTEITPFVIPDHLICKTWHCQPLANR